ncbi:MAG: hypothetical protein LBR74_00800 [Eubacterium sp.]|jgi:hypothetical protein|nr:hypothetical protein [Eubacterium sp.]
MNLGTNIFNAFEVVKNTHESINKLMQYCKSMAEEKGEYTLASPKFLRWRSDNNSWGWSISNFILLFQSKKDVELEHNDWRDGPVYVLEINLYDPENYDTPMINIAKYEYNNISAWGNGVSPAEHWRINQPLYSDELDWKIDGLSYDGHVKDEQSADSKWWGLRRIVGYSVSLTDITPENAYDVIFGGFDSLVDK